MVREIEILNWMVNASLTEDVALRSKPVEGEGESPEVPEGRTCRAKAWKQGLERCGPRGVRTH